MYLVGYGLGRMWSEGLRTDQLLLPGVGIPVSQVLSGFLAVGSVIAIFWKRQKLKKTAKTLDVVGEHKE